VHTGGKGERQANDELGKMNPAQRCNIRDTPSLNNTNYDHCSIYISSFALA
jgi:hypothetical protein